MLEEYHYTNSLKFLPFAYSYMLVFSLILLKQKKNSESFLFFLSFHIALGTAYIANGLLFPPKYMPDQYNYLIIGNHIIDYYRNGNPHMWIYPPKMLLQSAIFMPLYYFFGNSIFLGQILNCLFCAHLTLLMYQWFRPKITGGASFFFLTLLSYPSYYLWMSLNLREGLYMILTGFALYHLHHKNYSKYILICLPIMFLKFQIVLFTICGNLLAEIYQHKAHPRIVVALTLGLIILLSGFKTGYLQSEQLSVNYLVYMRGAMQREGGGSSVDVSPEQYNSFHPSRFLYDYFRGNFMPLPGQGFKLSVLLSSLENFVILLLFLIVTIRKLWLPCLRQCPTLFFYFVIASVVNSFVVSNLGTIMRYKLSYMYFMVIFLTVICINDLNRFRRFHKTKAAQIG
jgi:hypothetical protein